MEIDVIRSYHVHVYFDASSVEKATSLCEAAALKFGVAMGRVHKRNVGPHPMWSCQLGATPAQFEQLLPWLVLNRDGLIIFSHPETGDDLRDHRDRDIWLGAGLDLNLSIFR
ncbi:MAG: DOPA 4,5-dioxygenase family protein [Hyphomicrobiales bacterium]